MNEIKISINRKVSNYKSATAHSRDRCCAIEKPRLRLRFSTAQHRCRLDREIISLCLINEDAELKGS